MTTAPIIVSGEGSLVPEDRPYWTSPEMYNAKWGRPHFSKREVAQFFGRSVTWVVHFALGPDPDPEIGPITPLSTTGGRQRWELYDVELMAHTLLRRGRITVDHFAQVINVLKSTATMYGYDVGDPRYRMLWYSEGEDYSLTQATALVTGRLASDPPPATTELDRLADSAAWFIRQLQRHLEGFKP